MCNVQNILKSFPTLFNATIIAITNSCTAMNSTLPIQDDNIVHEGNILCIYYIYIYVCESRKRSRKLQTSYYKKSNTFHQYLITSHNLVVIIQLVLVSISLTYTSKLTKCFSFENITFIEILSNSNPILLWKATSGMAFRQIYYESFSYSHHHVTYSS